MSNPVAVVVGAGPGVGRSVARRFGRAGYDVALLSRGEAELTALGEELQAESVTAGWSVVDVTDPESLAAAITRFGGHGERLDLLHFNPSVFRATDALELTPDQLLEDVRLGVAPVLTMVQAARPFLQAGARVTATGSMAADHPSAAAPSLGVQKAALRNLVLSLDTTLRPLGVRAVSVTVNGTLAPGTPFAPARVADAVFDAASRPDDDAWTAEVAYDG